MLPINPVIDQRRNYGLDLLRAVAIFLVMCAHTFPGEKSNPVSVAMQALARGGWVGVDLFFVLSGFLIGGLLFQEYIGTGGIRIGRFYLRRGFKIYPLFWLIVALVYWWEAWQGRTPWPVQVAVELLFLQSFVPGFLHVTWSLAVEEHFYILLPLILAGLGRVRSSGKPFRLLPLVVVAIWILCLSQRWGMAREPFNGTWHFTVTHIRIDGLFFGVLLAYWRHYSTPAFTAFCTRFRWLLWLAGVVGLLPAFLVPIDTWYMRTLGLTVNWAAAGALVVAASVLPRASGIFPKLVAVIGRQSYAIYLCHFWLGREAVFDLARLFGRKLDWTVYALSYALLSFLIGALLTIGIETPLLALRDRLVPAWNRAKRNDPSPALSAQSAPLAARESSSG